MSPNQHVQLLVATRNRGKVHEIEQALQGLPIKMRYVEEFPNLLRVTENGATYRENAILKARNYARQTGVCALADDSGLEVDALGGRPGIYSARFGRRDASDHERLEKLLLELSGYRNRERTARFVCCMALAGWKGRESSLTSSPVILNIAEGKCEGLITSEIRGSNGFGFDPVFVPAGYEVTFGEMPADIKRAISHRAQAIAMIRESLELSLRRT